jgi:hypothetical protein
LRTLQQLDNSDTMMLRKSEGKVVSSISQSEHLSAQAVLSPYCLGAFRAVDQKK